MEVYSTLVGDVKPTFGVRTKKGKPGEKGRATQQHTKRVTLADEDRVGAKKSSIQFSEGLEGDALHPQMSVMSLSQEQMKEAEVTMVHIENIRD